MSGGCSAGNHSSLPLCGEDHSSCLESLRGKSKLMTLGNLICAGCGTGNGGGVGCAEGKVVRNPTLYPA